METKEHKQATEEEVLAYYKRLNDTSDFVFYSLRPCILAAFPNLKDVLFDSDKEDVLLICDNNYMYRVNVTADSRGAIIEDTVKAALRHA